MQNTFGMEYSFLGARKEDEGIIGVLKDRARSIGDKRMSKEGGERWVLKKAMKNVSNNDEKIRGQGITLTEVISVVDPTAREAILKDRSFASVKEVKNPITPFVRETSAAKNMSKATPVNTVESFIKIQFEDYSGRITTVATME